MNVATIVRFAQGLGFSGWREFQLNLRHHYLGSLLTVDLVRDRGPGDDLTAIEASLHRDIQNLHGALTLVSEGEAAAAACSIAEARRTVVISSGSYAAVGLVLAHLASFMGYSVTLETRGGAHVVAALASLEPGDCVVAISFWRLLKDVVLAARHARDQNMRTIAITDSRFSPLAQSVDHALVVPTEGIRFFQSITAALPIVYGVLAELYDLGGERVFASIEHAEELYEELDVLYT